MESTSYISLNLIGMPLHREGIWTVSYVTQSLSVKHVATLEVKYLGRLRKLPI